LPDNELADKKPNIVDRQQTISAKVKLYKEKGRFFWQKIQNSFSLAKIMKYLLARLLKPLIFFSLLFSLVLGLVYAGSYYKVLDAKSALDFSYAMPEVRASENAVVKQLLPALEWASSAAAAAGEIIQYRAERQEEERKKREEILLAEQVEQERLAKIEAEQEREKVRLNPPVDPAEQKRREEDRKKQEAELKKLAEARQQEMIKRANKLALYYSSMSPADAVKILKNMEDEEIIAILNFMPDATVSQILTSFEPDRASVITKSILKLHPKEEPAPASIRAGGVL
jgi:flagellar motility protein MotE (MotC chaperone)